LCARRNQNITQLRNNQGDRQERISRFFEGGRSLAAPSFKESGDSFSEMSQVLEKQNQIFFEMPTARAFQEISKAGFQRVGKSPE